MIVPIGVPSIFKISKVWDLSEVWVVSAIAWPGLAVGVRKIPTGRLTYTPLAGCPLTATISPKTTATSKTLAPAEGVTPGLVANFDGSEMSPWYATTFSTSIVRIVGGGCCPRVRVRCNAPNGSVVAVGSAFGVIFLSFLELPHFSLQEQRRTRLILIFTRTSVTRPLLDRNVRGRAHHPSCTHLNAGQSFCRIERHSKIY